MPPPGYNPGSLDFQSVAMTTSAKAANCLERVSGNDPESRLWQSRVRPFSLYPQIVFGGCYRA